MGSFTGLGVAVRQAEEEGGKRREGSATAVTRPNSRVDWCNGRLADAYLPSLQTHITFTLTLPPYVNCIDYAVAEASSVRSATVS